MQSKRRFMSTETLTLGAIMTAFVIILQCLAFYTNFFGPFATAVALVPIVIGSALCGIWIGAWLGFVFGMVVLLTGGAALFFAFSIPGAIITVLVKGTACGFASGLTLKLMKRCNRYLSVTVASLICPIVNTGVFLLGSFVFFADYANAIAEACELEVSGMMVFFSLAMANFLFEMLLSALFIPVTVKLLNIRKKNVS